MFAAPELHADRQVGREERLEHQARVKAATERAERNLSQSQVALARVTGGFTPVVDLDSRKEAPLVEGEPVAVNGSPDRTLADGTIIANSMGYTAEIENGRIAYMAQAAPGDMAKYLELFNQLMESR